MAKKQQTTSSPQLESTFGDVEVLDGMDQTYESAKVDVLGTQAVLTIAADGRPERIDRITKARMTRLGGGKLEFIGESDRLRNEIGAAEIEVHWIVTPKRCVDCGG